MEHIPTEAPTERPRRKVTRAERIAQLRALADQLEQRDKAERRKQDTRKKIILGGTVLSALADDPQLAQTVKRLLHERVTRENDRQAIADLL